MTDWCSDTPTSEAELVYPRVGDMSLSHRPTKRYLIKLRANEREYVPAFRFGLLFLFPRICTKPYTLA